METLRKYETGKPTIFTVYIHKIKLLLTIKNITQL